MKVKIEALDRLFSEFIRKRAMLTGGCEYCGTEKHDAPKANGNTLPAWKQLQTAHFHSRRKLSTRYDPDNASGLCPACHMHIDGNPYEHVGFYQKRLGQEKFEQLNLRANMTMKIDREMIKADLKDKIAFLNNGGTKQ